MRITFKVATAGESGVTQFPMLNRKADEYCLPNGVLNEPLARKELGSTEGIQFSSNDGRQTIAFVVEFLERIKMTYRRFADSHSGELEVVDVKSKKKKTTCERRLVDGRVAFVRVDVSVSNGAVRVALSFANPKNIVGDTENFAEIVAKTFADILLAIKKDIEEMNGTRISLVGGKNCEDMFSKRMEVGKLRELLERHKSCSNRMGCYCSPSCPSCQLYENGKCSYERMAG